LTQLRTLQTQTMTSLESTFADIRTKRQALRTALNANPVDTAAVTRLRSELDELQKNGETARTNARVSAVGLLTSDQRAALAQLEQALKLMAAAGQAARINLLAPPERDGEGFPGGGRGLNGDRGGHRGMPFGPPMMFR
jgi:Spy/CpxP family protein refolding chaperone